MTERSSFRAFLALSLAAHVAIGVGVVRVKQALLAHPAAPSPAPTTLGAGGETFDVPEELPLPAAEGEPAAEPGQGSAAAPRPARAYHGPSLHLAPGAGSAEAAPPPVFGAEGARDAVDLATSFTRSFPQAASTDPVWATVAFGPAGEADVTCEVDDAGALTDARIEGHPSPALRRGITRTLALVGGRTFTAHARRTRLHVVAVVSPDVVHDGLHGDVFAIGGSFTGGEGSAFFALSIGRRVDVTVRER